LNSKDNFLGEIDTVMAKKFYNKNDKNSGHLDFDWQGATINEPLNNYLENYQT